MPTRRASSTRLRPRTLSTSASAATTRIAAVSDDFIGRLLEDPTFERFFVGFSDDSKKRIRQHLVDFLCENTGGPCYYFGRDMKTAHAGMHVTKEEWDKAVALIGETLTALKVPAEESQELASLLVPLEKDIVEAVHESASPPLWEGDAPYLSLSISACAAAGLRSFAPLMKNKNTSRFAFFVVAVADIRSDPPARRRPPTTFARFAH